MASLARLSSLSLDQFASGRFVFWGGQVQTKGEAFSKHKTILDSEGLFEQSTGGDER